MAARSVERCWWTLCGPKYLANKSYRRLVANKLILTEGDVHYFKYHGNSSEQYFARGLLPD